eukprot:CAMPEP_0197290806 /NCGR_PEP_ID=MMETSP0890-20130614/10221_1 /TAXON_ID=44058 ORGANISM="Aureoumbra lagunensis, Strain CCMP1510" /NCGR_SAMPLE_ID=MMETSP0890 /ASSEMBLY_ACC=CAM_ASM_000533 /LENGTH=435 /DNA_ID=CAMNT_0042763113 /DNA_START=122 /DNA_END=1429 /DNA_ORIENTATION=+
MAVHGSLPEGFAVGRTRLEFAVPELGGDMKAAMQVSALVLTSEQTTNWAAVFTRNALCGAPVRVGKKLHSNQTPVRGIIANNKVSNVGAPGGEDRALRVCKAAANKLGESNDAFIPSSTGVIGWGLPATEIEAAISNSLEVSTNASAVELAEAIMTTDRYPKVASANIHDSDAVVVGVAKGAGMIEPNLGTMLVFIATDAKLPSRDTIQNALKSACDRTLSRISVDGDESTSDMAILLSSGTKSIPSINAFQVALDEVCTQLAHHIVRNGEGTNHVIRVTVSGLEDSAFAHDLGRFVVNGPLLKSAVAGNDPNVGRLVARIGQFLGSRNHDLNLLNQCQVSIGEDLIFEQGAFCLDPEKEKRLAAHLKRAQLGPSDIGLPGKSAGLPYPPHPHCVEFRIQFSSLSSSESANREDIVVLGSDLTYQYVRENADYRS